MRSVVSTYFKHQSELWMSYHQCRISLSKVLYCRSQWPRDLRRTSAAASLLRLWVRISRGDINVCYECLVLSGRGLCDELITRPEESFRLWCVVVCDLETWWMGRAWPTGGCRAKNKQKVLYCYIFFWGGGQDVCLSFPWKSKQTFSSWFQAFAAPFRPVTQRISAYRSHLQGSANPRKVQEVQESGFIDSWRWDR